MKTNEPVTPGTTFSQTFARTPHRILDCDYDNSKKTNNAFQETLTTGVSRLETLTPQKANHQYEKNETQNSDIDDSEIYNSQIYNSDIDHSDIDDLDTDYSELDKLFIDYSDINDLYIDDSDIDDSVGKQTGLEMIDIHSWKLGVRSPAEGFLERLNGFIPDGHTNSSGDIGK